MLDQHAHHDDDTEDNGSGQPLFILDSDEPVRCNLHQGVSANCLSV